MRAIRLVALLLLGSAWTLSTAYAQSERFEVSAGAGFTEPEARAGNDLNKGWNLDFRGGYKPSPHVALDLDFNYNRWNLNDAALARFGEPGGYSTIWSVAFMPVLHVSRLRHANPYVFAGPGLYYRNLSLTRPAVANTIYCDPFFGYCYPAAVGVTQVVASATTYKAGVNGGAGLEFRLGRSGFKAFGEARYSRMFTTHGADISFVPVTFGLRW